MSTPGVAPPSFPLPPNEYDPRYMRDFVRLLTVYLQQQNNPGEGRFTKVTLTDLPTSATGLETGALWNDSGTVKIA